MKAAGGGFLHLGFGGVSIAGEHFFYQCAGQIDDGYAAVTGGQKNHAARMPHENGGAGMLVMGVELFNADVAD